MATNTIDIGIDGKFETRNIRAIKEDRRISLAIMSTFAVLTIQYLILFYFRISNSHLGGYIQLLSKGLAGLLYLIALSTVIKRHWLMLAGTYVLVVCIFLYNYFIFPQNSTTLMSIVFPFFFTCIPAFVYSYSINNKNVLMDMTYKISDIVFVFGTVIALLIFTKRISIGTYSMSLSYYMLLPAVINMYRFFIKKSSISMIKCIVSMGIILSIGSRGAVMCFGVYIILAAVKNIKKLTYTRALIYSTVFSVLIAGIIYFENILTFAYQILFNLGIKSRTLLLFIQDPLHSSGRDWRYEEIISKIQENPILGIGIAGDRVFLGGYSHNIFIEIFSGFGIIIGFIIILAIVLICYKTMFSKYKFEANIIIVWFSIGFVPLMVSGSYLTEFKFWIFLGLAIRMIMEKRTIKIKKNIQEIEIK